MNSRKTASDSAIQSRYEPRRVPQQIYLQTGSMFRVPASNKPNASNQEENQELLQEINKLRSIAKYHSQLQAKYTRDAERAKEQSIIDCYLKSVDSNKKMVEEFNSKAVSCIMELHNLTHRNPDILDLHLLQVNEAAECLDTFLDRHIAAITEPETIRNLFVITGRGLNSANGIPKIKEKTKQRLRERYLAWTEINPGYLKVDISTVSNFTMDL